MFVKTLVLLLALIVCAPPAGEAAVIYTYGGKMLTDLPSSSNGPLGPFHPFDTVSGWVVFDEPIPDRTDGLLPSTSPLRTFQALAWEFSGGNALTLSSSLAGASGSFGFGTIQGRPFTWDVHVRAAGWSLDSWDFSDTFATTGVNARFDVPAGNNWSGPQPFDVVPEPGALASLGLVAALVHRRLQHRRQRP